MPDLPKFTPIKGSTLPSDFNKAVRMLQRPYIPISESAYREIMLATEPDSADVVMLADGRQVTFGEADGGFALMPLQHNHYFN